MYIHYLVLMGKLEELRHFLEQQPELLNAQEGKVSGTLLMVAAEYRQIKIVEFLLSKGADIYAGNLLYGSNVLYMLISKMSDVSVSDSAKLSDYYTIVAMILQRDAELRATNPALTPLLEVKNKEGHTPFWILRLSSSEDNEIKGKIQLMARAAEARVQHKRAPVARAHEDKEARHRGSVYSATVPKVSEPAKKYGGFARLLAAFGIMRRGPQAPEEVPLLKEKLKVS